MAGLDAQTYVDTIVEEVARSIAANQLAIGGVRRLVHEIEATSPPPENPDPIVFVGEGDPNVRMEPHGWIRLSELIDHARAGGPVETVLTQQWVVATYAKWEAEWRPGLAARLNVDVNAVLSDLFGDLRLLRNEIVHHGGLACDEHAGRCRVLTFEEGQVVRLEQDQFRSIIGRVDVRVDAGARTIDDRTSASGG